MDPIETEPSAAADPADFGWRVHGLLDNWTGKVDNKASIVLAIESAAFAFVVTQTANGKVFADPGGIGAWAFRVGLMLLLVAIALALLVVLPQLNRRQSTKDWANNSIYFGHLRIGTLMIWPSSSPTKPRISASNWLGKWWQCPGSPGESTYGFKDH